MRRGNDSADREVASRSQRQIALLTYSGDSVVLCYCNSVNRGALSAASLKAMGYRNAVYIDGGLNGYRQLVD